MCTTMILRAKTLILASIATLMSLQTALGATYTVTTTSDSGAGSLREAMTNTNSAYGADVINFNIPNTDPGYDSVTGTWKITITTSLPYLYMGGVTIDGASQTVNQGNTNLVGPEIVIEGNSGLQYAIALVGASNTVKDIIVGGCQVGIIIYNSTATLNTVRNCWLGLAPDGTTPFPNEYGILINNAAVNSSILNNIVSGNTTGGIALSEAGTATIRGNYIGFNAAFDDTVPNANGILLDRSSNNTIGGTTAAHRNFISGNTMSGIVVSGLSSSNNTISGNFIGTDITGMTAVPNESGIILANAPNNTIGGTKGNVISGNLQSAIILNGTGTNDNIITGNLIGTDSTGLGVLSNHVGVLLKSNSRRNIIGGTTAAERNIISGNWEIGVYIESSDSNIVIGNYLGPDATGISAFANGDTLIQGNGLELNTVSRYNQVGGYTAAERNIISGNRVYGMIFYGNVSENILAGNYIGTDVTGNVSLPNATGICVDGGSNHNIIDNNVLSGNISYGIFIVTNGTFYNLMRGNYVGTNAAGTDTVPNDAGLLLGGGTLYNVIGGTDPAHRNIFSGNRFNGIEAADILTDYNEIRGNYIGTDYTGTVALPNYNGIGFTSNPKHNIIDNNLISGNTGFGLILFEHSDSNIVTGNTIGLMADGASDLGNTLTGILIASGSSSNTIGAPGMGNTIAYNDSGGVVVMDTESRFNTISANNIYDNSGLGIDLLPPGPTDNDAGDSDTGPNDLMNFPVITEALYNYSDGGLYLSGTLDCVNPQNAKVELFLSADEFLGYGEGKEYLGFATPDASGDWTTVTTGAPEGSSITATATDENGNTSEFCLSSTLITSVSEIVEGYGIINFADHLEITGNDIQSVELLDLTGRRCAMQNQIAEGNAFVHINTRDLNTGIYLIRILSSGNQINTTKILITK
ncbi:MAG: right-handed parallel beta-helix repeat-containing protein [Bacteroidetes bacterium]|nr:right-handed parallel beta-helix repeat-containing protein [Bacteroidota bacterium]